VARAGSFLRWQVARPASAQELDRSTEAISFDPVHFVQSHQMQHRRKKQCTDIGGPMSLQPRQGRRLRVEMILVAMQDRLAIVRHAHGFPGVGHRGYRRGKERGRDGHGGQSGITHGRVFW
jgi:hypothetical protein